MNSVNEGTPRAGPHRPGLGFWWVVLSGPLLVRRFCAPPCPLLPVLPLLSSGGLLSLSTMLSPLSSPGPLPVLLLLSVCRPSGLTFPLPTWCTVETSPHNIYTESCTIHKRVAQRLFTQCLLL